MAVILYTSGTTGHPKGAMLAHLNIAHSAIHFQACMKLGPQDRAALAVPASHVTGLIAVIASMLRVGGTIVVVPEFKADSFIALLQDERISHTLMVPAMYNLCLMHPTFAGAKLDAWRIGGYGGAPMPMATIEALAQLMAYPGVLEAAVIAQACPVLGERVHAVLHAPGLGPDDEALRRHCAQRLADYKVPETIAWSATPLPRNANGKVMKRMRRDAAAGPKSVPCGPRVECGLVGA